MKPKFSGDVKWLKERLERIAESRSCPTAEITAAWLDTLKADASVKTKRRYEILREHFAHGDVELRDGRRMKLAPIQREYLRWAAVRRCIESGCTWEQAFAAAAEFVSVDKPVTPDAIKKGYGPMDKLLKSDLVLAEACRGLDHDFPIAMSGLEYAPPKTGTYLPAHWRREPTEG